MGGYRFEGKIGQTAPREDGYTFYIAGVDRSGNYSESSSITVQHPGIEQLVLQSQDVVGYFSKIEIFLPNVFSKTSQYVNSGNIESEEKDILGYRVHFQEIDDTGNPVGDEKIRNYDVGNLSKDRVIIFNAEAGKTFEIQVGAYDSVVHHEHNLSLYEQTKSQIITASTFKIREPEIPEDLIEPSKLTETLRTTINDAHSYATTINPGDIIDNTQAINNNIAKFYSDAIAELSADALTGDTTISVSGLSTDIESGATLAIAANDINSSAYAIVETTTETLSGATSIDITSLPTDLNAGSKIKLGDAYSASSIKQNSEEISLTVENLNDDTNLTNHHYAAISATYDEISLQVGNVETDLNKTGNDNPYDGINHNYGQIQINSDRITNTVSQISTENAIAFTSNTVWPGDTRLFFENGIDVKVDKYAKVYLSDSDDTNNYYVTLEVQSDTSAGSLSMDVEEVPTGVKFNPGTGVKLATEYFATQVNQLSDEYTVKIDGYTTSGDPISGGFGISVEGDETKWVDFNVVADKFRVFDTTGNIEGALFGIDTVDSIIYMNANEVQIRGGSSTASSGESWFQIDDHINIHSADGNLILDTKPGNEVFKFGGELIAASGKLGNSTHYVEFDGTNFFLETTGISIDSSLGNATFNGDITATDFKIYEGTYGGQLEFYNNGSKIVEMGNGQSFSSTSINETGHLKLFEENTTDSAIDIDGKFAVFVGVYNNTGILIGGHNSYGELMDSSQSSLIAGHSSVTGARIRLRDELNDPGLAMEATRDNKRLYTFLYGNGGSFSLQSNLSENGYSHFSIDRITADQIDATTKNFVINHPNPSKTEYKLYHSAVETPTEGDNIYRYEVNIDESLETTINLPEYFKYLNKNSQVFVSPKDKFSNGYGVIDGNKLTIRCESEGKYNILVIGTRKDKDAEENWNGAERLFTDTDYYSEALDMNKIYDEK